MNDRLKELTSELKKRDTELERYESNRPSMMQWLFYDDNDENNDSSFEMSSQSGYSGANTSSLDFSYDDHDYDFLDHSFDDDYSIFDSPTVSRSSNYTTTTNSRLRETLFAANIISVNTDDENRRITRSQASRQNRSGITTAADTGTGASGPPVRQGKMFSS